MQRDNELFGAIKKWDAVQRSRILSKFAMKSWKKLNKNIEKVYKIWYSTKVLTQNLYTFINSLKSKKFYKHIQGLILKV